MSVASDQSSARLETEAAAPVRAAYVHVPFCRHRCGYCDFTLVAGRDDLIENYLSALERELVALGEPRVVETLFLGGGTPTHLEPDALTRLFGLLRTWLPTTQGAEVSVEANPADLTRERIEVLAAAGVNRVSLGVQSLQVEHLQTLERDHRPEEVAEVVERLRPRISNVAIDLIFAIPGQTPAEWEATLLGSLALQPAHVSTYGLTWERGTAFWSRRLKGDLRPVDEETEREMYALAMDRVAAAGLTQYELSNFARPGCECRHNQTYWRGESYFGFGPGAASYLGGVRRINHRSTTTWIRRMQAGELAIQEEERLSPEERAREAIMLGLRQRTGIDLGQFEQRFGTTPARLEPEVHA
ncbi:MAG: radical SAM family heme chaperone HemW, partial [Planctomycetaceae bacterium]|nr:radical SAM family heme chaperone HemW [Planctomycetaceae bacterium]